MSQGNATMASSDEDPDSVRNSQEKVCINYIDAAQASNEELQNQEANDTAARLRKIALLEALKAKGKELWANPSNNLYPAALEEISSEGCDSLDVNFFGYESDTFKKFLSVVLPAERNENDRARIVKKLNKYCTLADAAYLRSNEFNELLERGTAKILESPVYLYFVLKDVKDCLLANQAKSVSLNNTGDNSLGENIPEEMEDFTLEEVEEPVGEQMEDFTLEEVEEPVGEQMEEFASEEAEEPAGEQMEESALEEAEEPAGEQMEESASEEAGGQMRESAEQETEEPTPGCSHHVEVDEERKERIVKQLTLLLYQLDERIKQLEESEVEFSDEEDSNYIKMQRYRERFSEIYDKLCTYTNKPFDAVRVTGNKKINFSDTSNLELNRAIEKWLNITGEFPDYRDVYQEMIQLNQSLDLNLNKEELQMKAQEIFQMIGNKLQRRRHYDLWNSLSSFLGTEVDPAVRNPELEAVLKLNNDLGQRNEQEVLDYYAERQEEEHLEPREVPDEEANCSPEESDDDDDDDDDADNDEDEYEDEEEGDDDEDYGEMDFLRYASDLKTSSTEDESSDESGEPSSDESGRDPSWFPNSRTRNGGPSRMNARPKNRVENNDSTKISVSVNNCEQIDYVGSKDIDSHMCVNSEKTKAVGTQVGIIPVEVENTVGAVPNNQDTQDNLVVCNSENIMKRKNENLNGNDNENVNIHPCKKFFEEKQITNTKNFEETETINRSDNDSDCEIVEIISKKEGEASEALDLKPNTHQVNYAFTNSNFNYNTVLSNNVLQKKHCFPSNYKNTKNQKTSHDSPANESTSIKASADKNALQRENKEKMKSKNTLSKPKAPSTITGQTSKDLQNNDLAISTATSSINCSSHQEKSGENMKSQKEVNKTNQNNDSQQGSSNEIAACAVAGSSSGGNGEDNNENNGKKPCDGEKQAEDNMENEDNEEDEEEGANTPEKPPETPRAAPNLNLSRTRVSGAAVFKPPQAEKVAPVRRNSSGKQLVRPGSEIFNSTPTASTSGTRQPQARKRKVNQNGGTQGTPQPGKSNVFTFQFKKGPATLKKPNANKAANKNANKTASKTASKTVNKAPTAASSSRDDDVEILQVTKKKRPTPAKPVQSDEEIVKNFLERSHPQISITTPKKRAVQNEPSPSVRQALETLSRLKGISATVVKGSSKQNTDDEVTIIGESLNTTVNKISKQEKTTKPSATVTRPTTLALLTPAAVSASVTRPTTLALLTPAAVSASATRPTTVALLTPAAVSASATRPTTVAVLTPVAVPSSAARPPPAAVQTPVKRPTTVAVLTPVAVPTSAAVQTPVKRPTTVAVLTPVAVPTSTTRPPTAAVSTIATRPTTVALLTPAAVSASATRPTPVAIPHPVATATISQESLLPKIVTVQGNVADLDDGTVIQDNLHPNSQSTLVSVAGIKTNHSENRNNAQERLVSVSAPMTHLTDHIYSAPAILANVPGNGNNSTEAFYSPQASVATASGNASTYQENLYDTQAPAASTSGNANAYEENFTGSADNIPVPRFRNVMSRSRRTPKKTNNIEYIILD